MRILINSVGSHGDILPFVALGKALRDRGHDVRLYVNAFFEPLVREAGLAISPIGSAGAHEEHWRLISKSIVNRRSFRAFLRAFTRWVESDLRAAHDAMAEDILHGNTAIVGSSIAFPARSVAEIHGVPVAIVHLSPFAFRSAYMVPRMMPNQWQGAPDFIWRLIWRLMDLIVNKAYGAAANRHRIELGLRPIRRLMHEWIHQADVLIGMFPQWFAPRPPDWPPHLQLTGFPLYDHSPSDALPTPVEAFLADGEPPVAFTSGTWDAAARVFFEVSVEACRRSGRRGILLTRHENQVPASLPASVARFDYVPFAALLPRLATLVHHGGIGTMSQAFRAGVPQLIRPVISDQFDNSERAQRLGVAHELLPKDYKVDAVVAALDQLTSDRGVRERCVELARWVETDGIAVACDRILEGLKHVTL